ncbi:MAG: aminotransferase class I/II-fold pyridoxal phosphate-dependent enzyme [Acidimicrobiia bacterium]
MASVSTAELESAQRRYDELVARKLTLDMTRGNPSPEQLALSNDMLTIVDASNFRTDAGVDTRNYGGLEGLPEARSLFAAILQVTADDVIIGDNSSLALMHDSFQWAYAYGVPGGDAPWSRQPVKVLCPVPGYDRHFRVTERLGAQMVPVPHRDGGFDVEAIARSAADDASVKAVWIVPKHQNPCGFTITPEQVEQLATMTTAAPEFRIVWDDAYAVHDLTDDAPRLAPVLDACRRAGNPDRVWMYGSTSKVTFAGGGVAAFGGSEANVEWFTRHRFAQTIGPDKVNQLRHARFLRDLDGVRAHMRKHADILRPKFDAVDVALTKHLGHTGLAEWTRPSGGYFVSIDLLDGCAKEVGRLAAAAGVKLTPAGATFPLGDDPRDRNLRLAPSFPSVGDIELAMEVFATCVLLAGAAARA